MKSTFTVNDKTNIPVVPSFSLLWS